MMEQEQSFQGFFDIVRDYCFDRVRSEQSYHWFLQEQHTLYLKETKGHIPEQSQFSERMTYFDFFFREIYKFIESIADCLDSLMEREKSFGTFNEKEKIEKFWNDAQNYLIKYLLDSCDEEDHISGIKTNEHKIRNAINYQKCRYLLVI